MIDLMMTPTTITLKVAYICSCENRCSQGHRHQIDELIGWAPLGAQMMMEQWRLVLRPKWEYLDMKFEVNYNSLSS